MDLEPKLAVCLGEGGPRTLRLKNPLVMASGTFGYGREYAGFYDPSLLGGLVTKGISLKPRAGNRPPRLRETAAGLLNSIGLANLGLDAFLAEKLPYLATLGCAVVVNLYAETIPEFAELARRLDGRPGLAALEVNVSCPNVAGGGMAFGVDCGMVGEATRAVRQNTGLPVWVKLTPNLADPRPMALAAQEAGADGVSLINTLLGMAIDARRRRPHLANLYGGLSGPAIKPVALRMVHQVAHAVDLPVIGLGGIASGEDVAEFLLAGARAVQVGTANFVDPLAGPRILGELRDFLVREGVADVNQLVGALAA